jgi:DNA (cytosine-5)-methyltransferase 1
VADAESGVSVCGRFDERSVAVFDGTVLQGQAICPLWVPLVSTALGVGGSVRMKSVVSRRPPRESNATKAPLDVVSLFAGCGGMDLGFKGGFTFLGRRFAKTRYRVIWANELNKFACATYRHNVHPDVQCGDIWSLMGQVPKSADVVIGGFPCQDISINGKGLGVAGGRSGLYRAMVEVVDRVRPRAFVAENVKGLLMRHNKSSLEAILRDFGALGYRVRYDLYQAADYGVPQTRERVLIVGTLPNVGEFVPPKPTHSKSSWITAADAIDDLKSLRSSPSINHVWSEAQRSQDQGSRYLQRDRPGYTMRAECHGNIQFHYELPRRISMREAARIQSFPDSFVFQSKLRETERQIGNAVPPILAWHVARALERCL